MKLSLNKLFQKSMCTIAKENLFHGRVEASAQVQEKLLKLAMPFLRVVVISYMAGVNPGFEIGGGLDAHEKNFQCHILRCCQSLGFYPNCLDFLP